MTENTLNIILNGNIVKGFHGETILQLARRHGIEIPTLCHDDRLEPFSSCYLCVVEVEGMRGHQPSCSTRLTDGMKIITDNESIRKSRKTALELILSNHYADCTGPCTQTCPAGVDVQGYIALIDKGLYSEAIALIKETNPLPAICGRVCVRPCETQCRRNLMEEGAPVGIDYLKRFAADQDLASPSRYKPVVKPSTGKKVAVIGAGPGGLSAAWFLQIEGHQVDIYEAAPKPGGWLRYGIPEYRLPNDILDEEVKNITDLGVNIFYNNRLGDNLSYRDIFIKYHATVLAIGSQTGTGVGCDGEDAANVFSGIEFLRNMEMTGQRYDFRGKTVAVIGGGNTAMDCCRTSVRCHADKVYVIYRRTEKEMPANPIEIHESKLEGVEYLFLTLPKKINKNERGEVKSVTCIRMELGEPDASGRRRPVPVENSDFEIPVDYILAAIGQKTNVNFIENINKYAETGTLNINKWGDIEADKSTLRTGIPSVFAAGDGVTGPATIIEAIAQARIAARSVHQFLSGLPIEPEKKPFTSKRENFRKQSSDTYVNAYGKQLREEMPTLGSGQRDNFNEVELGYAGEEIAVREAQRCLECGCNAFFNCDLQKYATQYEADQNRYGGDFNEYRVDFRHPFIEIDNNKCILCARCIRICNEVVAANALGLVNRGFKTYVAPAMGQSLTDTPCESCGMCISACPTGAISENVPFKPGPVKTSVAELICDHCSVGCALEWNMKNNFIFGVSGKTGIANPDGNICRYPRFGYRLLNDPARLTNPLIRKNGKLVPASFEEAFSVIFDRIKSVKPDENAFFAGARLTNEEMYLIHKLARAGAKTNNVGSFHYLGRGEGYRHNHRHNVPAEQLNGASAICIFGSDINLDHAVIGFDVWSLRHHRQIPVISVTTESNSTIASKVTAQWVIRSYYPFVKAVNHCILSQNLENKLFLRDRVSGFDEYRDMLLKENFGQLALDAGLTPEQIHQFAEFYNNETNAILIFSEKNISSNTSRELFNLAMITGKLGKTSNGIMALKEKNNAQGIFDMGASPHSGIGGQDLADPVYRDKVLDTWKVDVIAGSATSCLKGQIEDGSIRNFFIFGEDPVGCAIKNDIQARIFGSKSFIMVQDYFITPTAALADVVLPASFPVETGGSFTNYSRMIQSFPKALSNGPGINSYRQLAALLAQFNVPSTDDPGTIFPEMISLLPDPSVSSSLNMNYTREDNQGKDFLYGCDAMSKAAAELFRDNDHKLFISQNDTV